MGGFTDPPSTGGGGYDYVQDAEPADPVEGEEWYDTGENSAYVFDGAGWIEETVTEHAELGGVGASDHHSKTTSSDIDHSQVSNVQSDQHHTQPSSTQSKSVVSSWNYKGNGNAYDNPSLGVANIVSTEVKVELDNTSSPDWDYNITAKGDGSGIAGTSGTLSGNSSTTVTFSLPAAAIDEISIGGSNSGQEYTVYTRYQQVHRHNHSI